MAKFKITSSNAPDRQTLFVDVLKNHQRFIVTVEDNKGQVSAWTFRDALAFLIENHAEELETELFYEIT